MKFRANKSFVNGFEIGKIYTDIYFGKMKIVDPKRHSTNYNGVGRPEGEEKWTLCEKLSDGKLWWCNGLILK